MKLFIILLLLFNFNLQANQIQKTFDRTGVEINLTVNLYKNKSEMHKHLNALGYKSLKYSNNGIAIIYKTSNNCIIFAVEPARLNDKNTTVLGHELLHCIYGEYHQNDVK